MSQVGSAVQLCWSLIRERGFSGRLSHPRVTLQVALTIHPTHPGRFAFPGFPPQHPITKRLEELTVLGPLCGSCCQREVVYSHSFSVYPRETVKAGFLNLAPLTIWKMTNQEPHSWNGRSPSCDR